RAQRGICPRLRLDRSRFLVAPLLGMTKGRVALLGLTVRPLQSSKYDKVVASVLRKFQVGQPSAGTRLDLFLASTCSDLSRSRIQKLISEGAVLVGGETVKRSHVVRAGEEVSVDVPEPRKVAIEPEPIPLAVLYEDEHLLAIDKPAGLVVHPSPG